jgi:RNA polymerase sigma-70 factor (ECF subfamily)
VAGESRADGQLLAAAARGDDDAFAVLVRRHIRSATLLAVQLLGDQDDAEDVVQDSFSAVHRHAAAFDTERDFKPWLFGIVRKTAARRRIREQRRARLLGMWGFGRRHEESLDGSEAARVAALDTDTVMGAMGDLSPMQRACFDLVALRGVSVEEVAQMHGISSSTVRQHVFRARAALRRVVDGGDDASDPVDEGGQE